jgi:TolB protein
MPLRSIALPLALMLSVAPALAQVASPTPAPAIPTEPRETIEGTLSQDRTVIAVPAFATPAVTTVAGLRTDNLGRQIADVIAADLERSGLYAPLGPGSVRAISMAEVRAPRFADWQARNAENVVHGFVQTNSTGGFVVGCYLYDTQLGSGLRDAPGVSDGTHDPKVPQLQLHSVSLPAFPGRHVPLSARG